MINYQLHRNGLNARSRQLADTQVVNENGKNLDPAIKLLEGDAFLAPFKYFDQLITAGECTVIMKFRQDSHFEYNFNPIFGSVLSGSWQGGIGAYFWPENQLNFFTGRYQNHVSLTSDFSKANVIAFSAKEENNRMIYQNGVLKSSAATTDVFSISKSLTFGGITNLQSNLSIARVLLFNEQLSEANVASISADLNTAGAVSGSLVLDWGFADKSLPIEDLSGNGNDSYYKIGNYTWTDL